MAQPNPQKFSEFLIKIGDGGAPEVFSKIPLAMMSRGFNSSVATTKRTTPDQDNEDLVVQEQSSPSTRADTLTGKGKCDRAQFASFENKLGVIWNYQISLAGTGTWTGPCILIARNVSGNRTDTVDLDITLEAADELTFVAA